MASFITQKSPRHHSSTDEIGGHRLRHCEGFVVSNNRRVTPHNAADFEKVEQAYRAAWQRL
jgi:hypothetical protein